MEFWGVEVKPNETLKCEPGDEKYLHLSQVTLGEMKKDKGAENVTVFVKFNDQKLVLGTLSAEKFPQISYDLVFEKEFELSHSSKNTSLYFCGYKTATMDEHSDLSGDEFDSDEEPIPILSANGNPKEVAKPAAAKAAAGKTDASPAKPKAKTEEPIKADKLKAEADDEDDDDEDDDEDDEDIDEDDSDDEDMLDASDDEDDEDNSDEEEEETPKKVESAKKRSSDSASKTPVPAKKAKVVSPVGAQKTGGDGKKGGHTATPHPAKQSGKTPASGDKSKQQTPKSAGSVACKSCSKTFNSDNALQAHTKAKHTAAK